MHCPICNEEVRDTEQAERWGPEFAHSTCVTAYNAGKCDERERCARLCESGLGGDAALVGRHLARSIRAAIDAARQEVKP